MGTGGRVGGGGNTRGGFQQGRAWGRADDQRRGPSLKNPPKEKCKQGKTRGGGRKNESKGGGNSVRNDSGEKLLSP